MVSVDSTLIWELTCWWIIIEHEAFTVYEKLRLLLYHALYQCSFLQTRILRSGEATDAHAQSWLDSKAWHIDFRSSAYLQLDCNLSGKDLYNICPSKVAMQVPCC